MTRPQRVRALGVGALCAAVALCGMVSGVSVQPAEAAGATRYVAPAGSDTANPCTVSAAPCLTIGHALTQLVAGDTLQLAPGTYLEHDNPAGTTNTVAVDSVTIQSDPIGGTAANTIIDATGAPYGLLVHASHITVQNLRIRHADRDGILVAESGNGPLIDATISGNTVVDNDQCRNHPSASGCTIGTDSIAGISLLGTDGSAITDNIVTGNFFGIRVANVPGVAAQAGTDVRIVHNNASDNRATGIALVSTDPSSLFLVFGAPVSGNTANGNDGAGILVQGPRAAANAIDGNEARDNGLPGIAVHDGGASSISHNTLSNDGINGGAGGGAGDGAVGDVHTTGILVFGGAPSIADNTISDVFYGIWLRSAGVMRTDSNTISTRPGGSRVFVHAYGTPPIVGLAANAGGQGYWEADADGGAFPFGASDYAGRATGHARPGRIVGFAALPSPGGVGYWFVTWYGAIYRFGDADNFGDAGGIHLAHRIVGMAVAPGARGYWLVASDGGIFSYGPGARFFGSTGAIHLNQPIVGMARTPTGNGYWLVAADGGIFSYGDAAFHGSTGAIHLNKPIVGMAATPTGHGYWLVASDGGIFAFGDAKFFGSTGAIHLNQPIVGMAATPTGHGYWFAASDGGIFSYGDAHYYGSEAAKPRVEPGGMS